MRALEIWQPEALRWQEPGPIWREGDTAMSLTTTAQALPAVARASWEEVDAHLFAGEGDWVFLRSGLLHLVCERLTQEGDHVSRLEELLLGEFYASPSLRATFLDVLALVRKETVRWEPAVRELIERHLAQNPRFSVGAAAFPLSLEALRACAGSVAEVLAPQRDLRHFWGDTMSRHSAEETRS